MAGRNINEQDFLQMQQDAIRRVREMQARARQTLENAGVPLEPPPVRETEAPSRPAPPPAREPKEPPCAAPPPEREGPPTKRPPEPSSLLSGFHFSLDSEQILLMLLIYLLYKDHGDPYLMMALAYLLLT